MIDSVKISIPISRAPVTDRAKFWPTFEPINFQDSHEVIQFLDRYKGIRKFVKNPLVSLRQQGLVYPNVEIYETYKRERGYQCNVKPQISVPKMIQGQSFEEVLEDRFEETIQILKDRLKDLGIWVGLDTLKQATVTSLHYCMNILFPSEQQALHFLSCLNKMTLGERYENHMRDYANDGRTVRFHTKTFEWVAYMKYYDVLEVGKEQVSKKSTPREKEIVKKLLKEGRIPPVVRIEIRFIGQPSIRKHFKTIFGEDNAIWTFEEVFKNKRSRKVMEYYWEKLMSNPLNLSILCSPSREAIYRKIHEKFGDRAPAPVIYKAIAMFEQVQTHGVKKFRADVLKKQSKTTWYKRREEIVKFMKNYVKKYDMTLKNIVDKAILTEPKQLGLPI